VYLHRTGKYEIVELANGIKKNDPALDLFPWKCIGTSPPNLKQIPQKDKNKAGYGHFTIDEIIEEERPDVYIGAEDIWAFDKFWDKRWWRKINTILWTTIDSSPVLEGAIEAANNTDFFFCWSRFAQREMKKRGADKVEALHGPVSGDDFYKLSKESKQELRGRFKIKADDFIIGFVFRNQLRKSVPNLVDGFIKFKDSNPKAKAKLLLHTGWHEGWDIPRLMQEKGIKSHEILTTFFCKKCCGYEIKPFPPGDRKKGKKQDCPLCGSKDTQGTISVDRGISESQLNEIYGTMDVYCHPFTSGGQELPIQEAKLCELVTLVTDYSCGQDCSSEESGGMPLSWHEYREPGTQFIKASTDPSSIAAKLSRVFKMSQEKREKLGRTAREFVLNNYSLETTCGRLMEAIDSMPSKGWDFNMKGLIPNENYLPQTGTTDEHFILDIYKNMLKIDITEDEKVFKYLIDRIKGGTPRDKIFEALKKNVSQELSASKKEKYNIEDHLDNDKGKRMAVVLPESIGDIILASSLLPDIKQMYPQYNIYFITKPQYQEVLEGNSYIYKTIPYDPICSDVLFLEGYSGRTDREDHEGYFEVAILLHVQTQKVLNYTRNGKDKISLDLCI
jgi:glycosyltransferase involved in cell wall biosynthesis